MEKIKGNNAGKQITLKPLDSMPIGFYNLRSSFLNQWEIFINYAYKQWLIHLWLKMKCSNIIKQNIHVKIIRHIAWNPSLVPDLESFMGGHMDFTQGPWSVPCVHCCPSAECHLSYSECDAGLDPFTSSH